MWNTIKNILGSIGGTLGLLLIGTISFCVAIRIFINQAISGESDGKLLYIASLLVIVATLITIKLLSSGKTNIHDYAKEDGFDDLDEESNKKDDDGYELVKRNTSDMEFSDEMQLVDLALLDDNEENDNKVYDDSIETLSKRDSRDDNQSNTEFNKFDIKIDFDSSESLRGFGENKTVASKRVSLDDDNTEESDLEEDDEY